MRVLCEFEKRPRMRHLSHLDLQRAMQRALRRSGLPIAYSQGFHPHVLVSFASALSMGVPSRAEVMDFPLENQVPEEEIKAKLNAALPQDLRVTRVAAVDPKYPKLMGILKQASYEVTVQDSSAEPWQAAVEALLAMTEYMAVRKSKRSEKMVDIRPMLHALSVRQGGADAVLSMRVALEEVATLKPAVVMEALAALAGCALPDYIIERTGLFQVIDGEPAPLYPV